MSLKLLRVTLIGMRLLTLTVIAIINALQTNLLHFNNLCLIVLR